jgi:hypothetical protein
MPVFEAALRTRLGFYKGRHAGPAQNFPKPQTVSIEFEGRSFVWHAFAAAPPMLAGEEPYEFAPSITVVVDDGSDERLAAESLQRLLSALSFHYEEPVEAVLYGGSGESDAFHPAVTRARRTDALVYLVRAPDRVEVGTNQDLRLALAVYREGVNAGSSFYRFLAFWNVLDAVFGGEREKVNGFVNQAGNSMLTDWFDSRPPDDLATYLRDDARNALAHVVRSDARDTAIDPDLPDDHMRLERDSSRLRRLAKLAICEAWPNPVLVQEKLR